MKGAQRPASAGAAVRTPLPATTSESVSIGVRMPTRRQVIVGAAVAAGVAALPNTPAFADAASPFELGIASGDPLPDGVILWTRLMRAGRPIPSRPIEVSWQVAHDERFR